MNLILGESVAEYSDHDILECDGVTPENEGKCGGKGKDMVVSFGCTFQQTT